MADSLANEPEDEREIARLEKEALKEQERANTKKHQNVVVVGSGSQNRTTRNKAADLSRIVIYRLEYIMHLNLAIIFPAILFHFTYYSHSPFRSTTKLLIYIINTQLYIVFID